MTIEKGNASMQPEPAEQPESKPIASPTPYAQDLPVQYPGYPADSYATHSQVPTAGYQVPPAVAPPPMAMLRARSLRVPAMFVLVGLGLNIFLRLLDGLVPWFLPENTRDEQTGDSALLLAAGGLGVLEVGAFVGTAAAFITWLFLARKNLERWQIRDLKWGPGWAIGGWFIPFANLVIPYQVMNTVARGSTTSPDHVNAPDASPGLVWGWWLAWITANCAGGGINRQIATAENIRDIAGLNAISQILFIVAAVLAIVLIRRITDQQEHRQAALDQWVPPAP